MSVPEQPPLLPDGPRDPCAAVGNGEVADTVAAHLAKGDRRPTGTIWRANPREQGLIGLTDAIAWFGAHGWSVSLPLIDSQPYDLIVDDGDHLYRVQVKTTTVRSRRSGAFQVSICTNGGNQSFHTKKHFDPDACDLLYVLTDDRSRYLIPTSVVTARMNLTLSGRMARYGVDDAGRVLPQRRASTCL